MAMIGGLVASAPSRLEARKATTDVEEIVALVDADIRSGTLLEGLDHFRPHLWPGSPQGYEESSRWWRDNPPRESPGISESRVLAAHGYTADHMPVYFARLSDYRGGPQRLHSESELWLMFRRVDGAWRKVLAFSRRNLIDFRSLESELVVLPGSTDEPILGLFTGRP